MPLSGVTLMCNIIMPNQFNPQNQTCSPSSPSLISLSSKISNPNSAFRTDGTVAKKARRDKDEKKDKLTTKMP